MITTFNNFNLITENPDTVYYHNSELHVSDNDAIGFICDISSDFKDIIKIFTTEPGNYHSNLGSRRLPDGTRESSTNLGYKGRLWTDSKIITFWVYPNPVLFKKIIQLLEEKTELKIFNNGWKVEVFTNAEGDIRTDKEEYEEGYDDAMFYSNRRSYNNIDFIPVEEYAGSEDVPEEQMATHLLSWQEKEKLKKEKGVKGFGSAKTAWDKPHNIKWRQALHQEKNVLNFQDYILNETPDFMAINGEDHFYHYPTARPFFVDMDSTHKIVKKLYLGDYKSMHSDMRYNRDEVDRAYAGRLWEDLKVLSFWVYPSVDIFNQIIRLLEEELNTKMFNNGWRVEVVKKDDEILRHEFDEEDVEDYFFGDRTGDKHKAGEELIPIENYNGSEDQPKELLIQHMLNWQEKEKMKKEKGVKGFGSGKTAWDRPHNIKYRQTIYQENKKNNDDN